MTQNRIVILVIAFVLILAAFAAVALMTPDQTVPSRVRVLLASEVEWQSLNPLRGDKSPKAGTLWGDRGGPVKSGFLVKFIDGFSSPPHIHPVTYRGVVISGLVHNDVPTAEEVWLPPGSFWTQPAGEIHITSAKGSHNVAYIEIEKGPYLVFPSERAFERKEDPIKVEISSMTWVDPEGLAASADGPKIVALAGNPHDEELRRTLVKLPAGSKMTLQSNSSPFHAVVIQGQLTHEVSGKSDAKSLDPGSYFGSEGQVSHQVVCAAEGECLIYVRTSGAYKVSTAQAD